MPQRYNACTPVAGCNFYMSYAAQPTPPAGGLGPVFPFANAQLGMTPGDQVLGNLNTRWIYVLNPSTGAAIVANTATTIDATTFNVSATGTVTGHSLVAVPVNAGAWFEVSGATLNTAMLLSVQEEREFEAAVKAAAAVAATHATPATGRHA